MFIQEMILQEKLYNLSIHRIRTFRNIAVFMICKNHRVYFFRNFKRWKDTLFHTKFSYDDRILLTIEEYLNTK